MIEMNVSETPQDSPVEHGTLAMALAYAELGWAVLPIRAGEKLPYSAFAPNGVNSATKNPDVIRAWFGSGIELNIGIACGEISGISVVDIDPRNGGDAYADAMRDLLPFTVMAQTGSGGEHWIFKYHPKLRNKIFLAAGVDIQGNGSYIVVDPSIHPCGEPYAWLPDLSPFEQELAEVPEWILSRLDELPEEDKSGLSLAGQRYELTDVQIDDIRQGLAYIDADDYDTWVKIGMALHSTGNETGFHLWDQWSSKSSKYNPQEMVAKWNSFQSSGLNLESLFYYANQNGYKPMTLPQPIESVKVAKIEDTHIDVPEHLYTIPGVLGHAVQWINETAKKEQPLLSVQSALAFGATLFGRRYVTNAHNYSAMYFLNIAESGAGKEHGKFAIEQLLEACGHGDLIGNSGYTSAAGVMSSLIAKPNHFSSIDEFGKVLDAAASNGNSNLREMTRQLMEVWGRTGGTLRPLGYSTVGLSSNQLKEMESRLVIKPSLTLLAMSTPDALFDAVGSKGVKDGFLNRFVTVISDHGMQKARFKPSSPVPSVVIDWANRLPSGGGNLEEIEAGHDMEPNLFEIPIAQECYALIDDAQDQVIELTTQAKQHGLGEMWVRAVEQAMKISLIVALSDESVQVCARHWNWSWDYVKTHTSRMVEAIKTMVSDSDFEAVEKQVIGFLIKQGDKGATLAQIKNRCRRFRALAPGMRNQVLDALCKTGEVAQVEAANRSPSGAVRFVALEVEND